MANDGNGDDYVGLFVGQEWPLYRPSHAKCVARSRCISGGRAIGLQQGVGFGWFCTNRSGCGRWIDRFR